MNAYLWTCIVLFGLRCLGQLANIDAAANGKRPAKEAVLHAIALVIYSSMIIWALELRA